MNCDGPEARSTLAWCAGFHKPAKAIAEALEAFITYDKRQADAATSEGLPVTTPV